MVGVGLNFRGNFCYIPSSNLSKKTPLKGRLAPKSTKCRVLKASPHKLHRNNRLPIQDNNLIFLLSKMTFLFFFPIKMHVIMHIYNRKCQINIFRLIIWKYLKEEDMDLFIIYLIWIWILKLLLLKKKLFKYCLIRIRLSFLR